MALILIKKLGSRKETTGKSYSNWGEFLCSFCNNIVEKRIGDAKKCKSCGCQTSELLSEALKGRIFSEEHIQNIAKASIGRNKGKQIHTAESKQKIREAKLGKKLSKEHIQKIKENHANVSGENNPNFGNGDKIRGDKNPMYGKYGEKSRNWQGGISFEPYAPEFNKPLKKSILERDNYTCQDPNCDGNHKKLHIHHIDYDKKNNNPENLITLCISCHTRTNGKNNRHYFIEFYQNIMMGKLMEYFL